MRKGKVEKQARGREGEARGAPRTWHLPPSAPTRRAQAQTRAFLLGIQIRRRESHWATLGSGVQPGPVCHGLGGGHIAQSEPGQSQRGEKLWVGQPPTGGFSLHRWEVDRPPQHQDKMSLSRVSRHLRPAQRPRSGREAGGTPSKCRGHLGAWGQTDTTRSLF